MEIEVKESVALEDGSHQGVIDRVEYREEPFRYTDIFVKENVSGFELKYGCPTNSSMDTKLIKLLGKFTEIKAGLKVNPEVILKGRDVMFMTMQEKKGDKTYTRIVDGSLKPKVIAETVV